MRLSRTKKVRTLLDRLNRHIEVNKYKNTLIWKPLVLAKDIFVKLRGREYIIQTIPSYKGVYFPIYKSARTTFIDLFNAIQEKDQKISGFLSVFRIRKSELDKKYADHFRFTFVRNPYSRIVSCYKDKIMNEARPTKHVKFATRISGASAPLMNTGNFFPGMSFKEFVREIARIPDDRADIHYRSQFCFVTDKNKRMLVDFVGKLENSAEDLKHVCEKLGIDTIPELPHKNRTTQGYREYYDYETKALVQERYMRDFEIFGYDLE